ncbi:MAG TPA: MFS transporter [Chloroflexia bacterium]|jgi:MFS family permease
MRRVRLLFGISIFWLGLSMLSDGITTLVLPSQLLTMTDEESRATFLGLLTFVGLLLAMLVQPIAGNLSDQLRPRWGRRGSLALGVVLVLISLAAFGGAPGLLGLCLGFVFVQVAGSVAQAAQQGFIPDLVPPKLRGTASGFKGLMDIGGALVGFALLGQLLEGRQLTPALLALAATIVLTFLLTVALVREPTSAAAPRAERVTVVDAFRLDLRQHRAFAWLVTCRFLFLLGAYSVSRFWLFFIVDRLSLDPEHASDEAGMLLAGLALVTVIGSIPAGWAADRFGRVPLMLCGVVLSIAGVTLLIVAQSALQIFLFGGLMAIGTAAFAGANWALTADLVPVAEAARFFGLANFGTAGAAAAAGLVGPLIDWANTAQPGLGYTALFLFAAASFAVSGWAASGTRVSASLEHPRAVLAK